MARSSWYACNRSRIRILHHWSQDGDCCGSGDCRTARLAVPDVPAVPGEPEFSADTTCLQAQARWPGPTRSRRHSRKEMRPLFHPRQRYDGPKGLNQRRRKERRPSWPTPSHGSWAPGSAMAVGQRDTSRAKSRMEFASTAILAEHESLLARADRCALAVTCGHAHFVFCSAETGVIVRISDCGDWK